jgi:hypothetical protein
MKPISKLAAALAAALALAGGLVMAGPGAARAAGAAPAAVVPAFDWNEIIFPGILSQSNVLCLDDPGGSTQAGHPLQLWHCHGSGSNGAPQRWQFIPVATAPDGRTAYVIRNTGSFFCLDAGVPIGTILPPPSTIFQNVCPIIGSSTATVWLIRNPDVVAPAQFELEMADLDSGAVTASGWCMSAVNSNDVNGSPLTWTGNCSTNDPRELLTLG